MKFLLSAQELLLFSFFLNTLRKRRYPATHQRLLRVRLLSLGLEMSYLQPRLFLSFLDMMSTNCYVFLDLARAAARAQNMNRSQHASTDSLRSHSNCFSTTVLSTPLTGRINTTTLYQLGYTCVAPRLATCSPSHRGCVPNASSKVVRPCAPVSHVRERHRFFLARFHCPPDCPSIVSQGKATQPRAHASPDKQQRRCCFFSRHATVSRSGLPSTPLSRCRVATTQREARLARLLASAFAWLNTPSRSR